MFYSEKDFDNFYFYSLLGSKSSLISKEILWDTIHEINQLEIKTKEEKTMMIFQSISDKYHDVNSYKSSGSLSTKINFKNLKNIPTTKSVLNFIIKNNNGIENQVLFFILNTNFSIKEIGEILRSSTARILSIANKIEGDIIISIKGTPANKVFKKIIKEESRFSLKYHFLGVLNKNEILTLILYDKTIQSLLYLFIFIISFGCILYSYSN